jgi:prepilin-type N-terminal cleavage/methylation domain-containing protein/prepilin-type processing-associated H-X9-DG protein
MKVSWKTSQGFTLTELLVGIAIIAVLASLLLTALAAAKNKAWTISCINSKRQLAIAWAAYTDDNTDSLVTNTKELVRSLDSWVISEIGWGTWHGNTNRSMVLGTRCLLAPYVGGAEAIFQCPADRHVSAAQRALGWRRRIRSISMNCWMGDGYVTGAANPDSDKRRFRAPRNYYVKESQLNAWSPAQAFVFIDTHPDFAEDPSFLARNVPESPAWFPMLPSSLHGGGATLSFADGHAEHHRWQVPATRQPVRYEGLLPADTFRTTDLRDFNWLGERTHERFTAP